ncbi:EF-hand domain-containing protein [Streptomyces sp. NPDC001568]|uniref:EF-hand domain-containing protein n=1 Tax=Streptomyces sp. NPDC001568 TaxID=3364588 RepID=UPI003688D74D
MTVTPRDKDKALVEAFKSMDKDETGTITELELRHLLVDEADMTALEVEEIITKAQVSSSKEISFATFVELAVTDYPLTPQ